jgi:hypothetical protein
MKPFVVSEPVLSLPKQTMNGASVLVALRRAQGERSLMSSYF